MKPVRPRPAASLIIYRKRGKALEVLMGCRNKQARFQPGVYVFPGGMLERADHFVRPANQLNPDFAAKMGVTNSQTRAQALATAAIRETFEEVGLVVGTSVEYSTSSHRDWANFNALGVAPNLAALDYIGRAITPAHQPIRFDARFFCVSAKHVRGTIKDNGELTDSRWIRVSDRDDFNMMKVTHLMLDILHQRVNEGQYSSPFLYFINRRSIMKWHS
ncbi:MAG: NUDIX hydrolase [Pseudomonadota bacterium]